MKIAKVFILFSFLFFLIGAPVSADSVSNIWSTDVSLKEAENIAERFATEQGWVGNNKLEEVFYDIDESKVGYYYLNYYDGKLQGHVLVSASKEREPILQYGTGEIFLDKSTGSKGYYLGFYVRYADSANELISSSATGSPIADTNLISTGTLPKSSIDISNKWNYYLTTGDSYQLFATTSASKKELAVTRIHQRATGITYPKSACGPTTGAMIANYYKSQGYSVRGSSYYGGDAQLVNHLYNEMNSGTLGTTLSNYAAGLFDHLEHIDTVTTWTGLTYSHPDSYDYETFKTYIDSKRPSAIRYDLFVSDDSYVNYHFVAAIGYEVTANGSKYFGIKDPDGGANNTSTTWLNWTTQAPNFAIHLTWSY